MGTTLHRASLCLVGAVAIGAAGDPAPSAPRLARQPTVEVRFDDPAERLNGADRQVIAAITEAAVGDVRHQLPGLPNHVTAKVSLLDRDLTIVAGVTGSANASGDVTLQLSTTFPGGPVGAARAGLRRTVFHEAHHLVTGWTLDSIFAGGREPRGPLLHAMVFEGMADVFAIDATGSPVDAALAIPAEAAHWLAEILARPRNAKWNWGEWMNMAPDGRLAIGYRIGAYIVRRAMERSGKSVRELTALPPEQILRLAGVEG